MNITPTEKSKQKTRTFIIKNRQGFTQVSNKMLSDQNISYKAKGILCHILSHDTERFTITSKTLIRHGADGEKAIKSGLKELKLNGYLQITQEPGNKGNWNYTVNFLGNKFTDTPKRDYTETVYTVLGDTNKNTNIKNTNNGGENESTENGGEEKQGKSIAHNHEEPVTTDEPIISPTIPPEVQKDIDDNNRLLAEYKAREQQLSEPPPPPQVVARVEDLLTTSNQFIQSIGFGFTRNPRNILDAIYKQLPEDYQIKEDPKDIELVKSAINQYDSSPPGERDALAKKFYATVENMAKLYLIKKHGEEFRDKLYPEILNKNLIMYLNCNPTFKYCHGGFSNDIDGVYAEITRIVRKKAEKEKKEAQREEEKRIERERVRELMVNRPHYSDEQIHAMGLKTMSEILEASRNKGSEVDLLDEKYKPVASLNDRDKLREEELLRIMISGQRLNGEEQAEFDYLRRKKAMGIV